MKFIKKTKNVFQPQKAAKLSEVSINPGDIVFAFNDDMSPYGVCGAIFSTQMDLSHQIENKSSQLPVVIHK